MSKSIKEIEQIFLHITDYLLSGVLAFVVVKSFQEELIKDKQTKDDIFIYSVITSSYNTLVLALANTIKPNSDSIHLSYLFNCIRESKKILGKDKYNQIMSHITEFESELDKLSNITMTLIELRDSTVAHLDRKHVNNPLALVNDQPIKWKEMEMTVSVVVNGLMELGKHLGLGESMMDYIILTNFFLASKSKQVYDLFYRQ